MSTEVIAPSSAQQVPSETVRPAAPETPYLPYTEYRVRPRRRSKLRMALFFLLVIVPAAATAFYAAYTTSPVYSSEVSFAIRSRSGQTPPAFGGLAANLGIGISGSNDIYAIRSYLQSVDAFKQIDGKIGFLSHVTAPERDWLMRLPPHASLVDQLTYYRNSMQVKLSTVEQIITVETHAFDPQKAQAMAAAAVSISEDFVNSLNERARRDLLASTETEVEKAQKRVLDARVAVTNWRNKNSQIDPSKTIEMRLTIIANLEGQLAEVRAEIAQLQRTQVPDSPRLVAATDREKALLQQIAAEKAQTAGQGSEMAALLSEYERLSIERDIAEKSYEAAIESERAAAQDARQQQKYIVTTASPALNQEPIFPRPFYHPLLVLLSGLVLYALASFLLSLSRDYRALH